MSEDGRIPVIRVTAMPADTNPYGGVFGGWLMGQMGLACGSFASRRTHGKALLVAADAGDLKQPGQHPEPGSEAKREALHQFLVRNVNKPLKDAMPRWQMSDADLNATIAYLKVLGSQ